WKSSSCRHGLRSPVTSTTASGPRWRRVPAGSESRSTPRVVTFSPMSPGPTLNPAARSSSNSSEWIRWTWRRFGLVGSLATRERCLTEVPMWASPSTPSPSRSRMDGRCSLLKLWLSSELTATTTGGIGRVSVTGDLALVVLLRIARQTITSCLRVERGVEIVRFTDQYELAADLYEVGAAELRARDGCQGQPVRRWMAIDGGKAAAAVSLWDRPDRRTFLYFAGPDRTANPRLADAVTEALERPVYAFADSADEELVEALQSGDSRPSTSPRGSESDSTGFWRSCGGPGFRPRSASVAPMRSTRTDCSTWTTQSVARPREQTVGKATGNGSTRSSTESPPFDPSAYLVAVDDRSGDYAGLVRMWRNPDGPRFGLVGVLPEYRNTTIAGALLRQALQAASGWGHESFTAEVSP